MAMNRIQKLSRNTGHPAAARTSWVLSVMVGLAIVAEIMKAHGGNVEVNAGPHGGAVFTLVFPPALAHAPPVAGHD